MQVPTRRRRRVPTPLLVVSVCVFFFFLCLSVVDALAAATLSEQQIIDKVAATLYPGSPCEGRTVVVRASMDEMKAMTGWTPGTPEPGGAAVQDNRAEDCKVYILDRLVDDSNQYDFCRVYAHEYGHLAGAQHGDPRMSIGADVPCKALVPTITAYRAKIVVRAKFGAMPKWHVKCEESSLRGVAYCFYLKPIRHARERWRGYSVQQVRWGMPAEIKYFAGGVDKR
jgi:hypothetical protein